MVGEHGLEELDVGVVERRSSVGRRLGERSSAAGDQQGGYEESERDTSCWEVVSLINEHAVDEPEACPPAGSVREIASVIVAGGQDNPAQWLQGRRPVPVAMGGARPAPEDDQRRQHGQAAGRRVLADRGCHRSMDTGWSASSAETPALGLRAAGRAAMPTSMKTCSITSTAASTMSMGQAHGGTFAQLANEPLTGDFCWIIERLGTIKTLGLGERLTAVRPIALVSDAPIGGTRVGGAAEFSPLVVKPRRPSSRRQAG